MMEKRIMSIHDLKNIHVLNEPQLSRDGDLFVFVGKTINDKDEYKSDIFAQKVAEKTTKQWTFGNGKVFSPRFSPDGCSLVFASMQDEKAKPQLYLLSLDGGEAKPLTNLDNGANQPFWSPDSTKILFSTSYEKGKNPSEADKEEKQKDEKAKPLVVERLKYKSDASGFSDNKNKQLAIYDVLTGEILFITDDDVDHEPSGWSPDGVSVTYYSNKQGDEKIVSDIYTLNLQTKEHIHLTDGLGIFTHGTYSPDGRTLACFGHQKEYSGATNTKIWTIPLDTKKPSCVTKDWNIDVSDSMIGDLGLGTMNLGPVWSNNGQSLYFLASEWGNTNLYEVTLQGNVSSLTEGDHHVFSFDIHEETRKAIVGISSPTNPGEFYALSFHDKTVERLTAMNTSFTEEVTLQEPEEIRFQSKDGLALQGWLLKPIGYKEGETYPSILEIHGGPHAMYGNTFFHELQLFAAKGFAVFYCNPRGSHGYGQSFVNAVRGDYGGMDYQDLMSFTDVVLTTHPWIDKNRLGVTGGSYGGFMTNWIISHTHRFKAAATLRCISNWTSFYGVSDIGYFFTEWEVGADFLEDPEKLWKHSPLKYVNEMETPLLILHGEKDFRCPIEQGEQLFVSLKKRGKNPRFVRFPNANHELSRNGPPHLRYARLEELSNWFESYL